MNENKDIEKVRLIIVDGDAVLALQNGNIDVLGHQVNLRGVMGAGIAKQIKNTYPEVFTIYKSYLNNPPSTDMKNLVLGDAQLVGVGTGRFVANIVAQENYGWGLQTNYEAFRAAIRSLAETTKKLSGTYGRTLRIGLPYGIGCGLAGGSWEIIEEILKEELPDVILYKLNIH